MTAVPAERVRALNDRDVDPGRRFVLYWMTAYRRTDWNFALQHAVDRAKRLGRPLLVFEAVSCRYPFASDRLHRFILEGMVDNGRACETAGVRYLPYIEPEPGAGRGLLEGLAAESCCVVTDDFPAFAIPAWTAKAASRMPVRVECVDGNGLLPMRAADRTFTTAASFRRFLQKTLPQHFDALPDAAPLRTLRGAARARVPRALSRWPLAPVGKPAELMAIPARLPIDHGVATTSTVGGARAAHLALDRFVNERLERFAVGRNQPSEAATSELSAYLHFGHISSHEVFTRIAARETWTPDEVAPSASGSREGWWGMGVDAEAFLDQLVTWRELGFNRAWRDPRSDRYESLPDWARRTLDDHADDPRPWHYDAAGLEAGETHDPVWNAAQRQLVTEGSIAGYLRMLWGKKILEWTAHPREALDVMLHLNDKYALDGRDPNSISGITWVLGRYDRAWGPERPIYGKIRYMTSDSARRKLRLGPYLERYGPHAAQTSLFNPA